MENNQNRLINSGVDEDGVTASVCYVLLIIACLLIAGCGSTSGPAPVVDRTLADTRKTINKAVNVSGEKDQYYIVQRGDTLYSIAASHGVSLRELAEWNNISDTSTINPGQQISLTVPSNTMQPTIFALPQQSVPSIAEASTASSTPIPEVRMSDNETKTEPKGLKLPYSDQTLAQLQNATHSAANMPAVSTPANRVPTDVPVVSTESRTNNIARIEAAPPARAQQSASVKLNDSNIEWIWPTTGKILESYSKNSKGVRISGESGQSILASAAGNVVYSGNGLRGYGELVIIKHSDIFLSAYAYNSKLLVREGDAVAKGQKIAEMGNTDTDTTQLHFEIRKQGKPVDPMHYLPIR